MSAFNRDKASGISKYQKSNSWSGRRGNLRGSWSSHRPSYQDGSHYGHDDRFGGHSLNISKSGIHKPRVSFKKDLIKFDSSIFRNLDNEISIPDSSNRRQFGNRGRGRSSFRGRYSPFPNNTGSNRFHAYPANDSTWYSVVIPHGQKYAKNFLVESLKQHMHPTTFSPMMYKISGTDAQFFIDDQNIATKLAECDKKIDAGNGFKISIRVTPSSPPVVQITDALKERLKIALGKRYIQETNALDLSRFYQDPDLALDYWCPLSVPNVLTVVLDIVQTHIPNIEALSLESNKILHAEKLDVLAEKFGNLKILHIGDNKIKELSFLSPLKTLQLTELRLEGNPMCYKYTNKHEDYISEIRKMFPKLLKLDEYELPPPILFDLEDDSCKIPSTKPLFIFQSNEEAKKVASAFLDKYFMVFDNGNRQSLLDAYHETACFSLTTNVYPNSDKFSEYLSENRNLCRLVDSNRKRKLLRRGKLSVVAFISDIPPTQHDTNSFTMDISLVAKDMMLIIVTGLYKEMQKKNNSHIIRYFNRSLVIVPCGAGFCIINEQLHIFYATAAQEKRFGSNLKIAQTLQGLSIDKNSNNNQTVGTEEVKHQMTIVLCQQTKMNMEWSVKCLQEVNWDFKSACTAFQDAFNLGKIPSSAFNK